MTDAASAPKEVTNARVLKIAVPIVLANITVPLLGAVDTGVVGQLGEAAPIGAVGIGAIIISAVYWIFGFLRMGTTGLASQAVGAGDRAEVNAILMRALLSGLTGGVLVVLLQVPLFWAALRLAPASAEVEAMAKGYLAIRIWSAPAAIAVFGLIGWLIARERGRSVLALQLWMNGVNVVLDLWFVLGLDWGVEGVAVATFLAEWSGLAVGLVLCRDGFRDAAWRAWARIFDLVRLKRMMSVNGDIMIRSVLLQAAFMSFLFLAADFGDVTLAANQVLMQFLTFSAFLLDGFAYAVETLVGQALGARSRATLRRAAVLCSLWGIAGVAVLSVLYFAAGAAIVDLMTTAPEVREEARRYLVWIVMVPAFGLGSFMLDGIFFGATRGRDMRMAMIWAVLIYAGAVLALLPVFANHGLWAALMVFFVARAVMLGLRYPALEAEADAVT
jgi:MATE family multidrug resistance protein